MIVVDEAMLALTGYQFPNPIDTFYAQRGPDARDYYLRAYVKLAQPDAGDARADARTIGATRGARRGTIDGDADDRRRPMRRRRDARRATDRPAREAAHRAKTSPRSATRDERRRTRRDGRDDKAGRADTPIAMRSNFNPLAAFSPAVKTDADGKATRRRSSCPTT